MITLQYGHTLHLQKKREDLLFETFPLCTCNIQNMSFKKLK